jgi:hypothetical protein
VVKRRCENWDYKVLKLCYVNLRLANQVEQATGKEYWPLRSSPSCQVVVCKMHTHQTNLIYRGECIDHPVGFSNEMRFGVSVSCQIVARYQSNFLSF